MKTQNSSIFIQVMTTLTEMRVLDEEEVNDDDNNNEIIITEENDEEKIDSQSITIDQYLSSGGMGKFHWKLAFFCGLIW